MRPRPVGRSLLPPRSLQVTRISGTGRRARIPKGFCNKAARRVGQLLCCSNSGCEQRATLGKGEGEIGNPNGVVALGHDQYRHNPDGVGMSFEIWNLEFFWHLAFG